MQEAKIIRIGAKATDHKEPILLFFGEGVTEGLEEYSIVQKISNPLAIELAVGDKILFGDATYYITYVGPYANQNLQSIEHVSFVFSDEPKEKMASSVYLTPTKVPTITTGMKITYQG